MATDARTAIERFLAGAARPALLEPGEEILPLIEGGYALETRGSRLQLEAWDRTRTFSRRVVAVTAESCGRLELATEKFARKPGKLFLLDLARPAASEFSRRGERFVFRERFRLFLRRQFPGSKLVDISADADLEHSLSPAYPRAFLRHGQHAFAAIAAPPETGAAGVLTFGLIWLDYLRRREQRTTVEGLALYVPAGSERTTALRLLCLNPLAARFELFTYSTDDVVSSVDPRDHGNLDTHLEACRRVPPSGSPWWHALCDRPGVEHVTKPGGRTSLRVRGLEFAEAAGAELRFGLGERTPAGEHHLPEIARLADEIERVRTAGASDHEHPLYRQFPEAWLESMVRAQPGAIDASLLPSPIYGQVPAFAGGERGVIDLLASAHDGRLAVIEIKASSDIHLPLQAIDYWIRVKWHLDRGDFSAHGYFPGRELVNVPPRLLLVCPALEFHPSIEVVLSFLAPSIDVMRIGLAVEWRKGLRVMFRLRGADRP